MDLQNNPGQFMNPQGQGQPGQGSALMRLFQLRQQGATPQAGNNTVLPAAPVSSGSPINMQSMQQGSHPETGQVVPPPAVGAGTGVNPQASMTAGDPNLTIALTALSNYAQSHGKSLEADHNVPAKAAHGKLIASQTQPAQGSPVS